MTNSEIYLKKYQNVIPAKAKHTTFFILSIGS
jgi:hypothetical protein